MMKLFSLVLLCLLSTNILAFLQVSRYSRYSLNPSIVLRSSENVDTNDNTDDIRWHNPDFKKEDLNEWYCKLGKSLLTVGTKGVNQSHKNSLLELIQSHERVRVKIASDKFNIMEVAQAFLSDPVIEKAAVLLEVRRREFMVGRK